MDAIMRNTGCQFIQVSAIPTADRHRLPKTVESQGVTKKGESVIQALRPVYPIARILALPDNDEKFAWRNWKTMSCLFLLAWGLFLSLVTIIKVSGESFSYSAVGQITFYCIVTVYLTLFLKLSTEWPDLMEEWLEVEQQMVGMPGAVRASRKIRVIFLSIFIYAIVEHILCQVYNLERARICNENGFVERFFLESYDNVFRHVRFSMWLGFLLATMNFFLTLVWTFTDIFLICVCVALSVRFEQLKTSLKRIIGQASLSKY
ncbi:unnamed protein product [Nezara viridula]|uniref:Gustatory receptor n=1 Tax=Nezara viridula TaxID=85310 RepID=A0A9P0MWS8_NEZVI|nr:unnamed protein product [Nezara viridula]